MAHVLTTGRSGAGKTSLLASLSALGFHCALLYLDLVPLAEEGRIERRKDASMSNVDEEKRLNAVGRPSRIVQWTLRVEQTAALDRPVQTIEPTIQTLFGTGTRSSLLRGEWLGHAVHPIFTDIVLGTWTSATLLDLLGGRGLPPPRPRGWSASDYWQPLRRY